MPAKIRLVVILQAAMLSLSGCETGIAQDNPAFWPDAPPEVPTALFSRAGITVSDMEESLKLYRDIFGMTVLVDRPGKSDPRLPAFSGLTEGQSIRLVILRTETSGDAQLNVGYISLGEITNPDGSAMRYPDPPMSTGAEPGATMLMFIVADIESVYSQVLARGYFVISAPRQLEDGSWSELLMRGPSGERLWVTQRYGRDILVPKKRDRLETVVAGEHRTPAYRERDKYRHPRETLAFFGLRPDMHVVEIWPTAGWYTEIIAPYVREQGRYYGAHFDSEHKSEFLRTQRASFVAKLRDDVDLYGDARVTELGRGKYELAPAGSLDMVLTFRNVHNWTMSKYADEVFAGMYRALKPGGTLGIVDHRGEPHPPGDPDTETGYLRPDDVKALAERAGFVFETSSEVNANPADTKDHPQGVWTLPPSLRMGPKDYEKYVGIGESDRMTLRFRKPEAPGEGK